MSLAARLSVFFLAALALVLAGFSGAFYLIARAYLDRQLEERLGRALDTLVAAVDIETSVSPTPAPVGKPRSVRSPPSSGFM